MSVVNDREAMTRRLHRLRVAVCGMRKRCSKLNLDTDPCHIENKLLQKLSRLQSLKAHNDQLDAVLESGQRKAEWDEPNARLKDNLIKQVRFAQAVYQHAQRDLRDAERKLREDEVVLDKTEKLLKKRSLCPASPAMQVDTIRQLEKHKEMLAKSIHVGEKRYQAQRRDLQRIIQDRRDKMDEVQADVNRKEKVLRQLYRSFPRRCDESAAVDPRYWINVKRTEMAAKGKQNGNGNRGDGQRAAELFAKNDDLSQRMPSTEELNSEIRMLKIRRQA